MTCKESQQAMLLHDLLDSHEHKQMDQHRKQCTVCEKSWQEIVQMNAVVEKARQKNQPANPEALTNRIMTTVIRQPDSLKSQNWIEKLAFGVFTRFALSGVSVCLVILFLAESGNRSLMEKPQGPVAGLPVILSSQDFRKSFTSSKTEKKSLLTRCLNGNNKMDFACLKSKMKF